jgi:threonine/homoserine efflux transporter RhtA
VSGLRLAILTLLALTSFAANSILGRVALRDGAIDAASFTALRIVSGALMLALLLRLRGGRLGGDWFGAAALAAYAVTFSFAYGSVPAGIGSLLLFAAVQVTIIGAGIFRGERPHRHEWVGEGLALLGLIALLAPGLTAPPLLGSLAMIASGIAWAVYTLRGRRAADALAATAGNFVRACVFALPLLLLAPERKPGLRAVVRRGHLGTRLCLLVCSAAGPERAARRPRATRGAGTGRGNRHRLPRRSHHAASRLGLLADSWRAGAGDALSSAGRAPRLSAQTAPCAGQYPASWLWRRLQEPVFHRP